MMTDGCHKCKFWKQNSPDNGECRFNPPTGHVLLNPQGHPVVIGFFAPSPPTNWCSKYELGIALASG